MVLQDGEELAQFPGIPDAEAVKGLDHDGFDLAGLNGAQEALEVGPLVGPVPAFVVLQPLVDLDAGSLDRLALAERVLGVGRASEIGDGGHSLLSSTKSLPSL